MHMCLYRFLQEATTWYNVDFNEHLIITGFDKHTQYTKYYKGLAPHIKRWVVIIPCSILHIVRVYRSQ